MCRYDNRMAEARLVVVARQLFRTELRQVRGDELGVEQAKAAEAKPRHQMYQRHLRGIAHQAKHALAEEYAADSDAVEPADQMPALARFDGMGVAQPMQLAEQTFDLRI